MRRLIMVCGPYRADTHWGTTRNIERARSTAATLWGQGWDVFCPHMNTAHFDGICDDSVWLAFGLRMMTHCDAVYMMRGWTASEGSLMEHDMALKMGKDVIYERPGHSPHHCPDAACTIRGMAVQRPPEVDVLRSG